MIVPLFFLVSINLLFNNWAKDQVRNLAILLSSGSVAMQFVHGVPIQQKSAPPGLCVVRQGELKQQEIWTNVDFSRPNQKMAEVHAQTYSFGSTLVAVLLIGG